MNKVQAFLKSRNWGLNILSLLLAMASAKALLAHAGISLHAQGFFSARYVIYLLCWFGLDWLYRNVFWFVVLCVKPEWAGARRS